MIKEMPKRDYSLVGASTAYAIENGLASAEWYHTDIPRKTMKELMQRSDQPAIRDTIIWLGVLVASAAGAIWTWGTWWCVPFFAVYGVLYASASDSRWHECGHGTAFKTRWMNDVVYQIASFMHDAQPGDLALEPRPPPHRHDHRRPRRRDRGDAPARPAQGRPGVHRPARLPLRAADPGHATPSATSRPTRRDFIPESEWPKAVTAARWHMARSMPRRSRWRSRRARGCRSCWSALPRLYGTWHMVMTGLLQHIGLADNVTRPPAEHAHGLHEPGLALHLLEHELSRRTSHVPDGSLPRAAPAARADQGRPAGAQPLHVARLQGGLAGASCASCATRTSTSCASCRRRHGPTGPNSTTCRAQAAE